MKTSLTLANAYFDIKIWSGDDDDEWEWCWSIIAHDGTFEASNSYLTSRDACLEEVDDALAYYRQVQQIVAT